MPPITTFRDNYEFLSNFAHSPLVYEGETYPTVEHVFQAAKTFDPEERAKVRAAASPGSAKRLGRRVILRTDWETVKYDVMLALLQQKFSDPVLREKLLATGDAELIEGNTWGDRTWGLCAGQRQVGGQKSSGQIVDEGAYRASVE